MIKIPILLFALSICATCAFGQEIVFQKQKFEINAVKAEVVQLNGEQVLKVERDLKALPFDVKNLAATVDEPTYVKLKNVNLENGIIEVKMLSRVQNPSPFEAAQGFIGLAFRISEQDSAYESIYLRPKVARSENQLGRNHVVQYYSYPDYKFDRLRKESPGLYETYADVGLDEWITFRIELDGGKARLFINNQKYPSFIVERMKGSSINGSVALWVDIGPVGYFKDLKVTQRDGVLIVTTIDTILVNGLLLKATNKSYSQFFCMKYLLVILIVFPTLKLEGQHQSGKPLRYVFQKTTPSKIPYGNNPKAGHYANAGDAKIYYEVYGKGEPIVLLHGGVFGATIEMAQLIDSLALTNQIIAVSTRGHGKSEIGTEPMTYEQRANEVYAVVKEATKEKFMLLGFSDGAFAGFKYAGMYPQTIKKFIAVGATELYPGMRKFQFSKEMAFKADREYFEQQLALMPEPNRWEEFATGLMIFYSGLTVDKSVFEKIQCPVLLISGDRDDGCPVQNVINTYKMIPNCQLGIVPNGPHTVIQTNFDVVWEMVEPFFRTK